MRTSTVEHEVTAWDIVQREQVEVTRVPMDIEVAQVPQVRIEGDVTIVPVLEERLVVEKRLFLVELIGRYAAYCSMAYCLRLVT